MFVCAASDFMANEALVVTHVLCMLDGGKSDGVHVHGIGVVVESRQRSVSSRGNIGMDIRMQLLESLSDIMKLTSFC